MACFLKLNVKFDPSATFLWHLSFGSFIKVSFVKRSSYEELVFLFSFTFIDCLFSYAIHDTSSVVGAASKYGEQALQIATTVKLARALWIVPVAFGTSFLFKSNNSKVSIPYFIGLFILAMIANTYLPFIKPFAPYFVALAKAGLTLTLFLIGSGLSFTILKAVGIMPLLQGVILWIVISSAALWAVISLV